MIKFLKGLFGSQDRRVDGKSDDFTAALEDELSKVYDPTNEADRMGLAFLVTIGQQLELLGFETGAVPAVLPYTSPKCRGALLGISVGILEAEGIDVTRDSMIDAAIAAFALTFGDAAGREIAAETYDDILRKEPEVTAASEWARSDVKGVYESGGTTSAVGFYAAVQGLI